MSKLSKDSIQNLLASRWVSWGVPALLILLLVVLWRPIAALFASPALVRTEVEALGPLAPLGFIIFTMAQIVVAPIPGHPTQLLGGALFGVVWGSVYNVLGMLAGGLFATWLARKLGRPWLKQQMGAQRLARYEGMARLEATWVWIVILLIPLGDFPYFIAGLSRLRFSRLAVAIVCSRGPFTVLVTWLGARAVEASAWLFFGLMAAILGLLAVVYLLRRPLNAWLERYVLPRLPRGAWHN